MEPQGSRLLGARELDIRIHRLAFQILENHPRADFVLVGIHRRGVPLARRIARVLESERPDIPVGTLDITFYHDDPRNLNVADSTGRTDIPFPTANRHVILVDDVLYTGRTIRAAIDGLLDIGRPSRIELAVLVDRGHRELPIQPDYCWLLRPTGPSEYLRVLLREQDGQDGLFVVQNKNDPV
jgi:pyrimidine operon attenuation protein/uracil phosphoribosyltransferase